MAICRGVEGAFLYLCLPLLVLLMHLRALMIGILGGGAMLDYCKLNLVHLEHALFGCWLFTRGFGWYFLGTAWSQR